MHLAAGCVMEGCMVFILPEEYCGTFSELLWGLYKKKH
jgi:hypothetical protein